MSRKGKEMTSKFRLAVALVSSVALLLMTFDSTTRAQPRQRFVADTGVITLGPNQVLRITVGPNIGDNVGNIIVRFGHTNYVPDACNTDGVCKLSGTNVFTGPMTLMPGEVASHDILPTGAGVRGIVVTTSQKVRVNAAIVNAVTGDTDVVMGPLVPENITLTEVLISTLDAKVTISRRRAL